MFTCLWFNQSMLEVNRLSVAGVVADLMLCIELWILSCGMLSRWLRRCWYAILAHILPLQALVTVSVVFNNSMLQSSIDSPSSMEYLCILYCVFIYMRGVQTTEPKRRIQTVLLPTCILWIFQSDRSSCTAVWAPVIVVSVKRRVVRLQLDNVSSTACTTAKLDNATLVLSATLCVKKAGMDGLAFTDRQLHVYNRGNVGAQNFNCAH